LKRFLDWKAAVAFVTAFVLGTTLAVTYAKPQSALVAAQTQSGDLTNTITVVGSGEASGKPDVAHIQLGVEVVDADPGKALSQANDIIAKITKAVQDAGVAEADIQTRGFNLYPRDPAQPMMAPAVEGTQSPVPQNARSYQAQIAIFVRVKDISKAGTVIDAGIKAGANNVYNLTFGIDDPSKLEQQAREKAIANARERAQQLAKTLNVTLGDPIIVDESFGGGVTPLAYNDNFKGIGGAATQISGGQLSISVNLRVTFSMAKK
jgi:uncharacterized protein YggE